MGNKRITQFTEIFSASTEAILPIVVDDINYKIKAGNLFEPAFDTFISGGTYSNGVLQLNNNSGYTFSVSGFSTGYTLTSSAITSTLGYTPYNSSNPAGYITGATIAVSSQISGIVNNTPLQELGGVDKLINGTRIGKGGGNVENNLAVGRGALNSNTTGSYNLAVGQGDGNSEGSLNYNTTGSFNTAVGSDSMVLNTTGSNNTAIGAASLYSNISGDFNTAIGTYGLNKNTTGSWNTSIGYLNLSQNTVGVRNVAIGNESMINNTTGSDNTGVGAYALESCTTGSLNVAIGCVSLPSITSGGSNVGVGNGAGYYLTTGIRNTIIGTAAMQNSTTANSNIAIGFQAGGGITTGSGNIVLGTQVNVGAGVSSGVDNIIIKKDLSNSPTTGSGNTIIGSAGGGTTINNNVIISDGVGNIGIQKLDNNTLLAPTQTNILISGDTSGKAIVTKEYISNSISDNTIFVKNANQIVNQTLLSDKLYVLDTFITLAVNESIIIPAGGLNLVGHSFNVSGLFSSAANHILFTSPNGGSGDLILDKLAITSVGAGSKVFDIVDINGTHAIEFEYVNFSGCKSLGKIKGYRQGTMTTVGLYGCADGLQLSGVWNGFKVSNTNVFSFGASGTLFKKDVDTLFNNRLFLNLNTDFVTGSKLIDFDENNFSLVELLQINSSQIKVNGAINDNNAFTLIPNISPNNEKCRWVGNVGLPDSALDKLIDNEGIVGVHNIDWLVDTHYLVMTGDTTFTETNLPANLKNTKQLTIYLKGEFVPTFPNNWETFLVGTYKGVDVNEITIRFIKTGVYIMKIVNSLSVYPQPFLENLVPTSLLPSNTSQLIINGSFFTPATIVSIENQIVNSIEFVNQGQLILSVTTSAVEEEVDITISNGTTVVFTGILPINLGVVFIPMQVDWIDIVGDMNVSENGNAKIIILNSLASGVWDKEFDYTKDFIIKFGVKQSTLGTAQGGLEESIVDFVKADNTILFNVYYYGRVDSNRADFFGLPKYGRIADWDWGIFKANPQNYWDSPNSDILEIRSIDGIVTAYFNNVYKFRFDVTLTENLKLKVNIRKFDITGIKYIELP